jgi:hypothetical protein
VEEPSAGPEVDQQSAAADCDQGELADRPVTLVE